MNKTVSVVIPVYNVADYLKESVDCILNQSYENLQVILVDDGSTDGSSEIADNIGCTDSRVEVIHKKNEGLSEARNVGVTFATGEYVYFFDSDDLVEKNLIEDAVNFLETNQADFVTFTHDFFDEKKGIHQKNINNEEYVNSHISPNEELVGKALTGKIRIAAWSYVFKKDVFTDARIKFQKGKKYEDNDTTILLILASHKAGVMASADAPYYHYRMRKNSITSNFSKSNFNDLNTITKSVVNIVNEKTNISFELDVYCLNQYLSAFRILRKVGGKRTEYEMTNNLIRQYSSLKAIWSSKKTVLKFLYWKFWNWRYYSK